MSVKGDMLLCDKHIRRTLQNCSFSKAFRQPQNFHSQNLGCGRIHSSADGNLQADYEASKRQIQELQQALRDVDSAIQHVEANLDEVPSLPSSELPEQLMPQINSSWKVFQQSSLALGGILVLSVNQFLAWPLRALIGSIAGIGMGMYGFRKGSLDRTGAIAASAVGALTLVSSFRAAAVLLTFFITSSKLTTYCEDRKLDDEEAKKGGQRNWLQVACNGLVPSILIVAAAFLSQGVDLPLRNAFQEASLRRYTALIGGFLGYYSCCCGDTWASEVGQLSHETPRLITTFRPVRKGTNGGITRLGLMASAMGGLCMGLVFYLSGLLTAYLQRSSLALQASQQALVIPLGLAGGLIGSFIDSILGATVQFTGFNRKSQRLTSKCSEDVTPISGIALLSNNGVNLVSASVTALLTAVLSATLISPTPIV